MSGPSVPSARQGKQVSDWVRTDGLAPQPTRPETGRADVAGGRRISPPPCQSRSGSIDELRWRRERSRIVATRAWQLWTSGVRDIPRVEAKQVFRIDSYARGELRETKITRLRAMFSDDGELPPFLDHLIEDLNKEATV